MNRRTSPSLPSLGILAAAASLGIFFPAVSPGEEPLSPPPTASGGMHEVSPGVYEIGKLRIDQTMGTVTFPGAVNMDRGPLEYVLVTPSGNAHESLLVTADVQPQDLHLAMLLLGAKGAASQPAAADAPPAQISKEYLEHAPKLGGDSILITVKWQTKEGLEKKTPVEDWILKTDVHKPAERGPWIYNGSMFGQNGRFLAQIEGNFVALVTNPAALINNPRKGSDDDQIWDANPKVVPPVKTPLELTIELVDASKKKPAK
jgi:hypothetical protein